MGTLLIRQWAVFLFLVLPPLAAALIDGQKMLAALLGGPAAACILVGALWGRAQAPNDLRRVEAVISIVLVFILGIAMTAPAFSAAGLGWVDAVFEATSALTTTGFSMIVSPENQPLSLLFLRAWSQWCGGLVIAVAGLAFLMDRGPVARALGIADFGDEALSSSVRLHAQSLLVAYMVLTTLGVIGALILVPGLTDGPLLALSAVSTGGMAPRSDSIAAYSLSAQTFVVALSACGGLSLALPILAYRRGIPTVIWSTAIRVFVGIFAASTLIAAGLLMISGERSFAPVAAGLLNVVSLQTTAGFTTGPVTASSPIFALLLVVMAIGGQTGSTSGGIKIERVRTLLGAVRFVFRRVVSPPSAVLYVKVDNEIVEHDRVLFAIALVVCYLGSALVLLLAFTVNGYPAADSLFDIVSALSTVGAGTGVIGPDMPDGLKVLTAFAMLLGRVEFFGLLLLALPWTWKRRD